MLNLVKLKFLYEHVLTQVRAEPASTLHETMTRDVVQRFIDPLALPREANIIDLGHGAGYFLDEMKSRGYTNVRGISISRDEIQMCQQRGHNVHLGDMHFIPDGDESVDMLFSRHSLTHSPFPFLALLEYNRVLKPRGVLYIEVPRPDSDRPRENNVDHYSVLGKNMWLSLLSRAGFDAQWCEYEFPVKNNRDEAWQEQYYVFVCRRLRPVDVK